MDLTRLLQARSARALDEDGEGRLLVASDIPGTFQLYELDRSDPAGALRQLTAFDDAVSGSFVPGCRRAVIQVDDGGNERHQLYLIELDDPPLSDIGRARALTASPEHVHRLLGVRPDGEQIAFSSNKRNGIDFDVYVLDLESGDETLVYADGGWVQGASGYSPSGRYLSFLHPGPRPLDIDLLLADLSDGTIRRPLSHPEEAAYVSPPAFVSDDIFFAGSNVGRDFSAVVCHELGTGRTTTVREEEHDLECYTSRSGSSLLVVTNAGGASRGELFAVESTDEAPRLSSLGVLQLPGDGVIAGALVTPPPIVGDMKPGAGEGPSVTYTFSSPLVPGDIWCGGAGTPAVRLTHSPGPDPADGLVEPSFETLKSFDGETVPLFCYRPSAAGAGGEGSARGEAGAELPVVVLVHGGPEGQSVLSFNPIVQGLVGRGFAVVVPNVRGSVGYGKRYASLDDTTRRLDSVADLAAIHSWLPSAGLDSRRAALYGGSYGGYMVLAGVAFQPELWAAGVDIVGISDLVTFLENTSAYRRAHREREYGSLERDREFLERASPLRRADDIRAPLFVIHGSNDPRVPVSEARQLAASLERRGVPHELLVFEDEGHGLTKLKNRLEAYPRAVAFLERHLARD